MKIVYLTAGAAGMYCGSCMHDNTLARALVGLGVDAQLVPTYTPIRTDENNVSVDQVFFGGINVYLQQKMPLLRFLPRLFDRFLDNAWLIRKVTRNASNISPLELGKLAVSMLKGEKGNQRKEVKRLCTWLSRHANPDAILFTNILIGGCIPAIKRLKGTPCVVTLQGDDIFLDSLPDKYRQQCLEEIASIVPFVDRFLAHSTFYADAMSAMLNIPRDQIDVTPLGIDTEGFPSCNQSAAGGLTAASRPPTIGFLARLASEKGLAVLVDAFILLKRRNVLPDAKLKIAGWLGEHNRKFVDEQFLKLADAGLETEFEYLGSIDRNEKIDFLQEIDVFTVPTVYRDPKGLFVLEAMACGVPVVQPDHGAFPEMLASTGGGLLFEAGNSDSLAEALERLLPDLDQRRQLGDAGCRNVHEHRNSDAMARATLEILQQICQPEKIPG